MVSIRLITSLMLSFTLVACASTGGGSKLEKQQEVLKMKDETLTKLYAKQPDIRAQINSAPGYAVFSNASVNLLLVSMGTGYGVAKDLRKEQYIYMSMAEGGVGIGAGVKDYRIVMIFHTTDAINRFIDGGWSFGGNADAAAKVGSRGNSTEGETYSGDVSVYTLTESGLALQATVKGAKFWKDDELN